MTGDNWKSNQNHPPHIRKYLRTYRQLIAWLANNFALAFMQFYPLQCNNKTLQDLVIKVIYCLFHSKVHLCRYGILHGAVLVQTGRHEPPTMALIHQTFSIILLYITSLGIKPY